MAGAPWVLTARPPHNSMQATTVLVEGESDRLAVETLAFHLGHDLTALRVSVVPMGGATSIVRFLDRYGPNRRRPPLARSL